MSTLTRCTFTTLLRKGTMVGYHQYDGAIGRLLAEEYRCGDCRAEELRKADSRRSVPDSSAADFVPRTDREIVLANIRSQLLTLETIRPWEKNADNYSSTCANGAFVLMERKFASPDERLRSLDRARKANAAAPQRGACKPEESSAYFHRDCHRAIAGHHQFLRARCASRLCRCTGRGSEGRIRADQCRGYCRTRRVISTG